MAPTTLTTVSVCVVGGGPAGAVAAYLLAAQGVRVLLLESQADFERAFRGDTIHPSTMELLDAIGLRERLLAVPHTRLDGITLSTPTGSVRTVDLGHLEGLTPYPYVTLLPQSDLLEVVTAEAAARFPDRFELRMRAGVRELVWDGPRVAGVRYRDADGAEREVRAEVVLACDGRSSGLRQRAGLTLVKAYAPMDIIWFDLPKREPAELEGLMGSVRGGHFLVRFDRGDRWQIGYVILKGGYRELRAAGIAAFRERLAAMEPSLAGEVDQLTDWKQTQLLTVTAGRVRRWFRPGLLLLGDAAHIMSPVGGVGINYAIQDAVAAARLLGPKLGRGEALSVRDLERVQRRRVWPTRCIQAFQSLAQEQIVARALDDSKPFTAPAPLRLRFVQRLVARIIGLGFWREPLPILQ